MDANETRFHLLSGREDWSRAFLDDGVTQLGSIWPADLAGEPPVPVDSLDAAWLDSKTPELILRPKLARFTPAPGDRPVSPNDRRGAARDRYGNWYYVSKDRLSILVRSVGSDEVSQYFPRPRAELVRAPELDPGTFREETPAVVVSVACWFGALTITRDHYLVATSTVDQQTELLIFDLFAGGLPVRMLWPKSVPLEAWDLAPREPGGFWLLDRPRAGSGAGAGTCRLWEFNTYFQVVRNGPIETSLPAPEDFAPDVATAEPRERCPGEPPCSPVQRVTLGHAIVLEESEPVAVEPLPGGGALVLDAQIGAPSVAAYRNGVRCGTALLDVRLVVELDPEFGTWEPIPHDFAVLSEVSADMALDSGLEPPLLFVADRLGNQAFCFELGVSELGALTLSATKQFLPMRLFEGAALVASNGCVYYDGFGRFVPLVAQERARYAERAVVVTPALDGDTAACVWHRILFDGCIPSGTKVRMSSRATDADGADIASPDGPRRVEEALARLPWEEEPEPVRRASGSELPWLRAEAAGAHDTWEFLVQRAQGRYFQLRITLEGDGRHSPRLRALRAYFPRFSYLSHYLPACYRDDRSSASLLERMLANYEGLVTSLEDRALALGTLCDPSATPAEFLDWLGQWYAVYLDPAWPPARKRLFLEHALTFFQWRGTARGLRTALRLAFDECVDASIFSESGDRGRDARRFRVIEEFQRRLLPSAQQAEPPRCPGFESVDRPSAQRWVPGDGLEALNLDWRTAAAASAGDYPPAPPADAALRSLWSSFSETRLGFVPTASARELASWRSFLRRRYAAYEELVVAWGSALDPPVDPPVDPLATEPPRAPSFFDRVFPSRLPAQPRALDDWMTFHRYLLPMRKAAHRFSVSLPVRPQQAHEAEKLRIGLHLADRLILLEKPAHSAYRVELYWALFRVGEVRLGTDTELGQGSRLPELLPPLVLGQGALAEGRLAPRPEDWNRGRVELGRNPLRRGAGAQASPQPRDFENP